MPPFFRHNVLTWLADYSGLSCPGSNIFFILIWWRLTHIVHFNPLSHIIILAKRYAKYDASILFAKYQINAHRPTEAYHNHVGLLIPHFIFLGGPIKIINDVTSARSLYIACDVI